MTDETDEILADADLMEQLRKSREDIKSGRTVSLDELDKEIDVMTDTLTILFCILALIAAFAVLVYSRRIRPEVLSHEWESADGSFRFMCSVPVPAPSANGKKMRPVGWGATGE